MAAPAVEAYIPPMPISKPLVKQSLRRLWKRRKTERPSPALAPALAVAAALAMFLPAAAQAQIPLRWPEAEAARPDEAQTLRLPSSSPFSLVDVGREDPLRNPSARAIAHVYVPEGASAEDPVPAVVLIHGSGGILSSREPAYARQFQEMGVAAVVIDAFSSRLHMARGLVQRVLSITETMMLADVYAALDYLDRHPGVDGERVALMGFSYGGMVTTFAAFEQVAELYRPDGPHFAAHVAYYGPCVTEFEQPRATGAPILMLLGGLDETVDPERCADTMAQLREGGAEGEIVLYPEGYHQWDGSGLTPRRVARDMSPCRFVVEENGMVREAESGLPMAGPLTRRLLLAGCTHPRGYLIGRNDAIRAQSNAEVARFLNPVLFPDAVTPPQAATLPLRP